MTYCILQTKTRFSLKSDKLDDFKSNSLVKRSYQPKFLSQKHVENLNKAAFINNHEWKDSDLLSKINSCCHRDNIKTNDAIKTNLSLINYS